MVKRFWRVGQIAVLLLCLTACVLVLFLPLSQKEERAKDRYECVWADGTRTQEQYASAYSALTGISEGEILLSRGGIEGKIAGSEGFVRCEAQLKDGPLAELLELTTEGLAPLERAALFRAYGDRGYYADEMYCFDGERVSRTGRKVFKEIILVFGDLPKGLLFEAKAKKLVIRAEAELSYRGLCGALLEEAEAAAPYLVQEEAIYLQTAGGKRLVAALPNVKTLKIDCDFIDDGALAPCRAVEELILPASYEGTLRMLFGEEGAPPTLKRLNGEYL